MADKPSDKSPGFRLTGHSANLGAAAKKASRDDNGGLAIALDGPAFGAAISAVPGIIDEVRALD